MEMELFFEPNKFNSNILIIVKLKIGIISQQEFFFLSIQKGWTEVQQPMVVASDRNAEPKVKMKKEKLSIG